MMLQSSMRWPKSCEKLKTPKEAAAFAIASELPRMDSGTICPSAAIAGPCACPMHMAVMIDIAQNAPDHSTGRPNTWGRRRGAFRPCGAWARAERGADEEGAGWAGWCSW